MSLSTLLQIAVLAVAGTQAGPSLEAMAKAERPLHLPCGLDASLGVPSDKDLKALRQEAKEFQDNSSLREAWVSLEARKILRKYLSKHAITCADATTLRTEALNIAYQRVDDAMPLKRQMRFNESLVQQMRRNPEAFTTTVVDAESSSEPIPAKPKAKPIPPGCDTASLYRSKATLDSLWALRKAKMDTFHMASSDPVEYKTPSGKIDRLHSEYQAVEEARNTASEVYYRHARLCPEQARALDK